MITEFNKGQVRALRPQIEKELEALGKKLGVTFKLGRANFWPESCTFKLDVSTYGMTKEAADFTNRCEQFRLSKNDLYKTFYHNGKQYQIIGLKPQSHKYPVLTKQSDDGSKVKFPVALIRQLLGYESNMNSVAEHFLSGRN